MVIESSKVQAKGKSKKKKPKATDSKPKQNQQASEGAFGSKKRKFQFKMGLPKIIQIPFQHVLANQNTLKFKKGAPLKHFLI